MDGEEQLQNATNYVDPRMMADLYNTQNYRRSATTDAFFSVQNLTRLIKSIDDEVSAKAGFPVAIVPDNDFYLTAAKHADAVPNTAYVQFAVQDLNAIVFRAQVSLHLQQIERRKLFFKWFIYEDRAKVMPRSQLTYGRHRIDPISVEDYNMKNPDSRFMGEFQQQVQKMQDSVKMPSLFSAFY